MNERQRADQLARAIDELLNGRPRPGPAGLDDQELQSLMHVVQARLGANKTAASASADHETAVWQRLIARLEGRPQATHGHDVATDAAMQQTVAARREVSAAILSLAARRKDEARRRVQERIKGSRAPQRKPHSPSGGAGWDPGDMPPTRTRFFPTGDVDIDSLLAVALNRPTVRHASARAIEPHRLHEHRRDDRTSQRCADLGLSEADSRASWGPLAATVAIVLLIIAALGSVPGLAYPTAAGAVQYVGQHLGVIGTDAPLPSPGPAKPS